MDQEVLYRYLYGKATDEEQQQVLDWLDSDPEKHMAEINSIHYLELAAQVYGDPAMLGGGRLRRLVRYTMVAAASIGLLFGVWHFGGRNAYREVSSRIARLETPAGQRMNVTLEDGTVVQLNAGTILEYPPVFAGNTRWVKLSGEALFEVQHDAQRPFVVETFACDVEVLGTKFNVQADKANNRFSTTLVEGSVQVRNRLDTTPVITLQPHDMVELVGSKLCKTRTEDFRDLCWTEGLIHIKSMPFDDLMAYFEKVYNVKIVINRPTLPKIELRSGKVRISDGVDYALQVLQQVSDFTYIHDEDDNLIEIK